MEKKKYKFKDKMQGIGGEKIHALVKQQKEKMPAIPKEKKPAIYGGIAAVSIILLLLVAYFLIPAPEPEPAVIGGVVMLETDSGSTIYFFGTGNCPACDKQRELLEQLQRDNPGLNVVYLDFNNDENALQVLCERFDYTCDITPTIFSCDKVFIGYLPYEGDLEYMPSYRAYKGHPNQVENSVLDCI